ncbi:MAG TPA: hypothetical protein VKR06_34865 [Ktedonosporobacter sp.]|nr:hypothetical protein [Ktedonosporobacter sp.]
MNRQDIRLLQSIHDYPALSILLPTHRTRPANSGDPLRVKNLVTEAKKRLLNEYSKRDLEPLFARLDKIVSEIDYEHTLDGLAIFVNRDVARQFSLPFTPKERVIVDETFATRDLVMALNHAQRYWVLVLSEKPARLYSGLRDALSEVTGEGFPLVHTGPGGTGPLPGGKGIDNSAYRDDQQRHFFRQVDAALKPILANDPLPLVVVGIDRNQAFFKEVSQHTSSIIATLHGSHDKTSAHELAKLVWPLVEAYLAEQSRSTLKELDAAVNAQRYVSTMGEVWRAAQEGRGRTLVVEEGFHYPARLEGDGRSITPAEDPTAPDVVDDAVDEAIETIIAKGGKVVFVDDGALKEHQHIALILRY